MPRPKAILSWSSGKDSAFALHETRKFGEVEIVGLLTTLTSSFGRVSMHGVREALLDRQAEAVGLPCWKVMIPSPCPNEVYEREMASTLAEAARDGVRHVVFGDLFLEDLRRYREDRLTQIGMSAVFPLWMRNTAVLAREMIAAGLQARVTCVDPRKLDRSFAGRVSRRPASQRRSVRREWRVSYVRLGRPDVLPGDREHGRRRRGTGRVRIRGRIASRRPARLNRAPSVIRGVTPPRAIAPRSIGTGVRVRA